MALASLLFLVGAGSFAAGWFLCTRTQSNRMSAAITVSKMGVETSAAHMMSAQNSAAFALRLAEFEKKVDACDTNVQALATVNGHLDRTVAAMFNGLVNSGVLRAVGQGERGTERQRGETRPPVEPPPLSEAPGVPAKPR